MSGIGVAQHVVYQHNLSHSGSGSLWHVPGASPGAAFAMLALWVLTLNLLLVGVVLGVVAVLKQAGSKWRALLLTSFTIGGVAGVIIGNNIAARGSDVEPVSQSHRWLIYVWVTLALAVGVAVAAAVSLRLRSART